MKVIYTFMIGLVLFNFYACTKQEILTPNDFANSKLEITYLDDKNEATESRTSTILMKLKDDESGFIMVSRCRIHRLFNRYRKQFYNINVLYK